MKRTALKRKTPLQAVTPGLKRSRLKTSQPGQSRRLRVPTVSTRTAAYNSEFAAIRPLILRRAGGVCEACGTTRCGPVTDVHHRQRRSNRGSNLPVNLLACSNYCHLVRIHGHPAEAYRRGLLVHSGADPASVPVSLLDPQ